MAYIVFMLFNLNKFGLSTIILNCFIRHTRYTAHRTHVRIGRKATPKPTTDWCWRCIWKCSHISWKQEAYATPSVSPLQSERSSSRRSSSCMFPPLDYHIPDTFTIWMHWCASAEVRRMFTFHTPQFFFIRDRFSAPCFVRKTLRDTHAVDGRWNVVAEWNERRRMHNIRTYTPLSNSRSKRSEFRLIGNSKGEREKKKTD